MSAASSPEAEVVYVEVGSVSLMGVEQAVSSDRIACTIMLDDWRVT